MSLSEETIVAISTPPGRGAIGIVRISGSKTKSALKDHCRFRKEIVAHPREMIVGDFLDDRRQAIDSGLGVYYPAPYSYTGEDLAEFFLHGNPLLLRRLIALLCCREGVRPAEAGEFTKRAYLNGKLDITQAEAVQRLIAARSEWELEVSRRNFTGALKRMVSRLRSDIIHLKAEIEAQVDFSSEDLTFESRQQRVERVEKLLKNIAVILRRGQETERISSNIQVALVGVPNAGKSSLFNQMLGRERAIVSAEAGTTRDYISEEMQLQGVTLSLVDTAGLRETTKEVEKSGINFSRQLIQKSQIVLHVIDGARAPYPYPEISGGGAVIHVISKSDLENAKRHKITGDTVFIRVSSVTGEGLEDLRSLLCNHVFKNIGSLEPLLLEERHRYHVLQMEDALKKILVLWEEGAPDEIVALEVDRALENCGAISGRINNEEVLGRIFSLFCIGK